jgi:hypothetical protein
MGSFTDFFCSNKGLESGVILFTPLRKYSGQTIDFHRTDTIVQGWYVEVSITGCDPAWLRSMASVGRC